jgi:hypothetical protein
VVFLGTGRGLEPGPARRAPLFAAGMRRLAAGLLCAWFAAGTVAEMQGPPEGPYRPARYWVDPRSASQPPQPLKDNAPGDAIYTPKPFDPHHPQHRLY